MDKFELTFGHLIAYLIPGFLALYPLSHYIPAVASLVGTNNVPQAEALLPLVIVGLAVGIVINAFSWALLRPIFSLSGVKRPENLNYTGLRKDDLEIYNTIIEVNFRYHQFYANILIALLLCGPDWVLLPIQDHLPRNASFFLVASVLFLAARDSLKRAYVRMLAISTREETIMTNGDSGPGKGKPKNPVHNDPATNTKSELKETEGKQTERRPPEAHKDKKG